MKLSGIRVLDLSLFLPGPHLTMMMADHGAEVISLEPPGGEPVRQIGLQQNGASVWFRNVYRGKKSINLNLKSTAGKEAFLKLCATADVLIEAFRPGVMARLGLDYQAVKAVNPGIVYCSISAFGQDGPKALKPAHDLSIQADSGTVFINQGQDGQPAMPGMPVADMAGSLMAFSGILMALLKKQQTGAGDYLDISMQDSLVAWLPNVMGPPFVQQRSPSVKQERSWGGAAFYQIYQTADQHYLTLGGSEAKFVSTLLTALQRPDLIAPCQPPPGQQQQVIAFLKQTFATQSLAYWEQFLGQLDICWAPVRGLYEALQEPHLQQRQMLLSDAEGNPHLGVPIKYQQEPAQPQFSLPGFSEHTIGILRELGYSDDYITFLKQDGVFMPAVEN